MSHNAKVQDRLGNLEDDVTDDLDIDDSDYGFIISSSGELKTFFCPDDASGFPPKQILKIFKIFKINNVSEVLTGSGTLH
jgi:hypothetical protein